MTGAYLNIAILAFLAGIGATYLSVCVTDAWARVNARLDELVAETDADWRPEAIAAVNRDNEWAAVQAAIDGRPLSPRKDQPHG